MLRSALTRFELAPAVAGARADRPAKHHLQPRAAAPGDPPAPGSSRRRPSPRRAGHSLNPVQSGIYPPVDLLGPVRAFDRQQQRRKLARHPARGVQEVLRRQGGNLAALVAYYAFFSLFPLLLVFVTVLGFVLQGDPSAQHSIENSVLGQFPVIGAAAIRLTRCTATCVALIIGIAAALALGRARRHQGRPERLEPVWAVPHQGSPQLPAVAPARPRPPPRLGLMFLVSTSASGLVTGGLGGPAAQGRGHRHSRCSSTSRCSWPPSG